jgi:large-conductance mechanosensitive channel
MKESAILRVLCSIPVILIILFLVWPLGIVLMLVRFFLIKKSGYKFPTFLIILGALLLVPSLVNWIFANYFASSSFTNVIKSIVEHDLYIKLFGYGKLLIIVGILFIIIVAVVKMVTLKLASAIGNQIKSSEEKRQATFEKNDLIMKERKEEIKNTHVVTCNSCGSDNVLHSKTGFCKYCRKPIEYSEEPSN